MRFAILLALPGMLGAQLIPPGSPIPKGANPPVVFLNGYQASCAGVDFAGTFGKADTILQASQIASVFFDNCTITSQTSGKPTIEALGIAFGQFLAGLRYADGTAVSQVDVVSHSMGGLIVRSYLAGKQDVTPAAYIPPPNPGIRRAIFLATPHFGTALASLLGSDSQTSEMALGSQFLFDLNTWNEGLDDLRGVDALAVAGSGGTGSESMTLAGFDDGVVTITSASLGFLRTGRTRVVGTCHAAISLLLTFGLCAANTQPIAAIADSTNVVGQIVTSFLNGTDAWQSLGQAIEANPLGSTKAGIDIQVQDSTGTALAVSGASATTTAGNVNLGLSQSKQVAYSEYLPASVDLPIQIQTGSSPANTTQKLPAGTELPVILKPGPVIHGAVPAGGAVFPLDVAPGAYVAIYGTSLAGSTLSAPAPNYPRQLGDVQVNVNGAAIQIQYISAGQLNVIWPDVPPGLTKLTVVNAGGSFTTNVIVQPAVPSVFTLGGPTVAAAENAVTGVVIGANTPLHAGDYVALFLTGLGQTPSQTTVTVGGQSCGGQFFFSGHVAGFAGLDQVNCQVPGGVTGAAVPVVVTTNGRASNTVTLNIQ